MSRRISTYWRVILSAGVAASVFASPVRAADAETPKPHFIKPPKGAIVLFDGKDASAWVHYDGKPIRWKLEGGAMTVVPKTGDIRTKETFGHQHLHVEFKCPLMPKAEGQGRGNSGVYVQGLYEIQVLDSYGIAKPGKGDCGALYDCYPPKVNACLPPDEWQSYDITFRAPRFDKDGKLVKQGRITCVQNGIKVQDNVELKGPTRAHMSRDPIKPGPLMLQDHGNPVSYRNVWVVPLPEKPTWRMGPQAMVDMARLAVEPRGPLTMALKLYRLVMGALPTTKQGLHALIVRPSGLENPEAWRGPYLMDPNSLKDPWGTPYGYRCPAKGTPMGFELWSAGPDKTHDTMDDIGRW